MLDTTITLIGNLVENPVLRVTSSGVSVCGFRLASTPRRYDRSENRWVDGNTLYLRVSCWRQLAENVSASLSRGDRALVVGRLRQSNFETQDGDRRVSYEIDADAVAAELTWRPVEVRRVTRSSAPVDEASPGDQDEERQNPATDDDGSGGEERAGLASAEAAGPEGVFESGQDVDLARAEVGSPSPELSDHASVAPAQPLPGEPEHHMSQLRSAASAAFTADPPGVNAPGADTSGVDLPGVDLPGADLPGADPLVAGTSRQFGEITFGLRDIVGETRIVRGRHAP